MAGDVDRFHRDPGAPFDDLKKEKFAQARARGASIKVSSNTADIQYMTGMTWNKNPAMEQRVKELRRGAEDFIGVSVGWILNELKTNAKIAREEGQLKSSNEAFKLIYEIVSKDPTVAMNAARAIPAGASIHDVKRELMRSLTEGSSQTVDEAMDTDGEEVAAQ